MKLQRIKTLAPLYEKICEINKFYEWKLEITYTPKQPSVTTTDIIITRRIHTFSGCILKKILNLEEMKKIGIGFYLETKDNKIFLRIFL